MTKTVYLQKFASEKLEALLDRFKKHLLESDRSGGAKVYPGRVRLFAEWFSGRYGVFDPKRVTALDLVQYRNYLQNREGRKGKASPATVNTALASLKVFFGWLKSKGEIADDPSEEIRLLAEKETAPKWLDRNQQLALLRAVKECGNARDEAIIVLMLHTGLRISEVCSLEREDIRLSERSGRVIVRKGKGNKYREVPLNKTARKSITKWLEKNPEGPLFPNRYGAPMTSRSIYEVVAKYAYRAKLKNITPHTLRHTFCKNAVDVGVSLERVAKMAGHGSLDVTKRYTVPSMEDLEKDAEKWAWE